MTDFLGNIGIGVFDLDEVLQEGFSSIVPDRFRNQAKVAEKQRQAIEEQTKVMKTLADSEELSAEQREVFSDKLDTLTKNLKSKTQERTEKTAERALREQTLGGTLQNLSTTWAGRATAGMAGAIVNSVRKTFSDITQQVDETGFLSDNLLSRFDKLAESSREVRMNNEKLFNTVDKNFETFLTLRREFGLIEDFSVTTIDNISQLENIIGLSADEATDLLSTFRGINRNAVEANTTLIKQFSLLANQEGVAFRDVMDDITENADFFATYMSQSSDKISEIIIKAQKLGTSFSDFSQIFESFSDIESTIEKQARMSIFAGRRFDFLSVLEQLQQGNVGQAQSNIMGQLGGINQGTFDNPFVKRQLSEGFGVDVQTLNKLFDASRNQLSEQQVIQKDFKDELATFNEQFKQLGFGTIKKDFTQHILNPLNQMFKQNSKQLQEIFEGIGTVIKGIGILTTWAGKWLSRFQEYTDSSVATLSAITGATFAISKGISQLVSMVTVEGAQLSELKQIKAILASQHGTEGTMSGGLLRGGTKMSGLKATGYGLGGAVLGGAFTGLSTGSWGAGLTSGAISGLGTGVGALLGGPMGALIGGSIGASVGDIAGRALFPSQNKKSNTVKANRGGIFTKRYEGKMDVAETGKPEGFVPLETQDGKPTMPADLSDRTIKKLAGAMSKMKFEGQVNVDGKKQSIEFYNHAMNPSSALNV